MESGSLRPDRSCLRADPTPRAFATPTGIDQNLRCRLGPWLRTVADRLPFLLGARSSSASSVQRALNAFHPDGGRSLALGAPMNELRGFRSGDVALPSHHLRLPLSFSTSSARSSRSRAQPTCWAGSSPTPRRASAERRRQQARGRRRTTMPASLRPRMAAWVKPGGRYYGEHRPRSMPPATPARRWTPRGPGARRQRRSSSAIRT